MNYIDDKILDNIKWKYNILNEKEQKKILVAVTVSIMIPLCIVPTLFLFKKFLIGTILILLGVCINIILMILYRNLKNRIVQNLLNLYDFDDKIHIVDVTDSYQLDEFYKENAVTFKAVPSIKVLSFIYNLLNNQNLIKREKLDVYILYGEDLKKKFDCKEIDDKFPFICISRKDLNFEKLTRGYWDSLLFNAGIYQCFCKFGDFVDKHVERYDWSGLSYYTEADEVQKYFSEFFDESNKIKNCRLIPAFQSLQLLAEHQWHTYKLLDNDLLDKVDKFIADNVDVESEEIMRNILDIIVYLGLGNRFREMIKDIDKVTNPKVIKLIKSYEKKYGSNVDNPYSNLIHNKWRYELVEPNDIVVDWSNIHTVERNGDDILIYIDRLYNPMYDKYVPEKEPLYILDCMILLKNAKIVSEIAEGFGNSSKDKYISFEEFCKKGCEEVQSIEYDKIKREFCIRGYQSNSLVSLLFKFENIHLYWNI